MKFRIICKHKFLYIILIICSSLSCNSSINSTNSKKAEFNDFIRFISEECGEKQSRKLYNLTVKPYLKKDLCNLGEYVIYLVNGQFKGEECFYTFPEIKDEFDGIYDIVLYNCETKVIFTTTNSNIDDFEYKKSKVIKKSE